MRSDEDLVRAIRRGETSAFDELYARYSRRLFGYVLRILGRRDVAEDVFQDVFMEVLRKDALDLRDGQFSGWLFTVARNRCLSELRKAARPTPVAPNPSEPRTPEETAEQSSKLGLLEGALAQLSDAHREVLLLKEVGGLTYRQIAEIQAVPEGTAKSRLHFALRAVKAALGMKS